MVLQRHLGAMRRRPPEEEPEGPFAVGDLALTPGDTLEICFLITSVNRKKKPLPRNLQMVLLGDPGVTRRPYYPSSLPHVLYLFLLRGDSYLQILRRPFYR